MNKQSQKLAVFLLTIAIASCGLMSPSKPPNTIYIELKRQAVDPWIKNSTIVESSCFNPLKMDSDYTHEYDIKRPQECESVSSYVKIMTQCIFTTVGYQANFKFNSTDSNPFKLVLDLRTPWSWIKSPACRLYSRGGEQIKDTKCEYQSKAKGPVEYFSKTYECQGECKVYDDKCGQIDYVQEGLSVFGSFISSQVKLSDPNYKKLIKGFKLIHAHGVSGQQFLMGDGVLGLGKQHTGKSGDDEEEDNEEQYNYNDDEDEDADEENEDEDDEEDDDNKDNKKGTKKPNKNYSFFEHGTDIWSAISRVYGKVNPNVFALYLAEHDSIKPQLLIGSHTTNYTELIHSPEKHPLKWIKLPIFKYDNQEELARSYFQWRIPVRQIVFRYGQITKKQDDDRDQIVGYQNRQEILLNKETEAQLSLQTSAMILPQEMMDKIIEKLNGIYGMSCFISKNYIRYVQCSNLDKKLDVSELAITIHVGYGLEDEQLINVDPSNLLLGCKKSVTNSDKWDCYLNLQLSVDDQIIFGDSVMRESYWVFDVNGRKIGLAPAKSNYNDKSFWREIKTIIGDVEDVIRGDIIFLLRFFIVLIILSAILFLFVNWKKIYQMAQRRLRYKSVVDPSELATLDLDKSDMVIKYGQTDDQEVHEQIQELEQNESFDAL